MVRLINAQLAYYYRMHPREIEELDDREWGRLWQDLVWVREQEAKTQTEGGA